MPVGKASYSIWLLISLLLASCAAPFTEGQGSPRPPDFVFYLQQPKLNVNGSEITDGWQQPTAVATIGDRRFVLDTGHDRILELDGNGAVRSSLLESGDGAFLLQGATAMTALDGSLYVANSEAGQVVVLSPEGAILKVMNVALAGASSPNKPYLGGIAAGADGTIYVTDSSNDLLLKLDQNGRAAKVTPEARSQDPRYRLKQPLGLAIDRSGNLYVADSGNGRVMKYSSQGRYLHEFTMNGNPNFFSPRQVAVDDQGNVYFTDGKRSVVEVFRPDGVFVGIVGVLDASQVDSPPVLREPYGLSLSQGTLFVVDRQSGLFGFGLDTGYWQSKQIAPPWNP